MAENVIIALEQIQIEHEQGQRRARHVRSQNLFQGSPVADAGQRVVEAQVGVLVAFTLKASEAGVQLFHVPGEAGQDVKHVLNFQNANQGQAGHVLP